jgi:hypothetical protein
MNDEETCIYNGNIVVPLTGSAFATQDKLPASKSKCTGFGHPRTVAFGS